jgi:polysaccharide pyruvyl transferase WcaK-like protein/O-antigen/teichoic acid export membrane protein
VTAPLLPPMKPRPPRGGFVAYWYAKIRRDELLKNSGYLMLMSATMAGFGFAFWLLCSHLYSPEAIGIATSLISAASLISYVSLLGLNNTFVRFLPSSADRNGQINTGLAMVFGAGLLFSAVYVTLLPVIAPGLSFVSARWPLALCFVTLTALSAMNLATDSVFVAFREARYNLIVDGIFQSLVKLALPLALIGLGAFGIYLATGAGAAVAVVLSLLLMIRRFHYRPGLTFNVDFVRRIRTFSGATYTAHLLNLSPILVLPIIVLSKLGAAAAGFFFIAFQLASLINAVAFAVSQSLFAEGSQVGANLQRLAVRSAIVVTSLITPIAFGLAVTGRFFLQFFGRQYARNAASTLTLLSLAAVPVAVNAWSSTLLKVTKQLRALVVVNVVYALIICGGAWVAAHKGLTWVGGAWLLGNSVSAVLAIAVLLPELRRRTTTARGYAGGHTGGGHPAGLRTLYARIVVSNAYSFKNKGDAAIVLALVQEIHRVFGEASITIQTTDPISDGGRYGTPTAESLLWILLSSKRDRALPIQLVHVAWGLASLATFLTICRLIRVKAYWLLSRKLRHFVRAYEQADLVIACGGGYLRTASGRPRDSLLLLVTGLNFLAATYVGKRVYLHSQSVGPFHGRLQRAIARFILNRVDLLEVREEISLAVAQGLHIKTRTLLTADAAFLLSQSKLPRLQWSKPPNSSCVIGVTVRDWFHDKRQFDQYCTTMGGLVRFLIDQYQAHVVYLPQVIAARFGDDDRIVARHVSDLVKSPHFELIEDDMHPLELIRLCHEMKLLVGTRMHSNIFALSSGVPVVAIEYEHKTRGIMEGLGLGNLVVDIQHIKLPVLKEKVSEVLANHDHYSRLVDRNLKRTVAQALRAVEEIKEAYASKA